MAETLRGFLEAHPRLFVLTGAGCSTASGIPDYRDAAGAWKNRPPVTFAEFAGSVASRRRYWARSLVVPDCPACGGMLKPRVVFFGENVPRLRVEAALGRLAGCDAVLVVGSSLMVYSGYRFCLAAVERGLPIAAVNLGRTRADHLLALKVEAECGSALARLASSLRETRII